MWIKICANTSLHDAQLALDLGADAIGFVFAPSARRITPQQAGVITAALQPGPRPVERIGVFQTTDFEEIRATASTAGLTGIQLHHKPDPELIAALCAEFGHRLTLTQTLHWPLDEPAQATAQTLAAEKQHLSQAEARIDRILVDAKVGPALGGTGRSFQWAHAGALFHGPGGISMIVAGGLNPENVTEAVKRLNPWGVDVASGVEKRAGRKDSERLRLFIERARAAGATAST